MQWPEHGVPTGPRGCAVAMHQIQRYFSSLSPWPSNHQTPLFCRGGFPGVSLLPPPVPLPWPLAPRLANAGSLSSLLLEGVCSRPGLTTSFLESPTEASVLELLRGAVPHRIQSKPLSRPHTTPTGVVPHECTRPPLQPLSLPPPASTITAEMLTRPPPCTCYTLSPAVPSAWKATLLLCFLMNSDSEQTSRPPEILSDGLPALVQDCHFLRTACFSHQTQQAGTTPSALWPGRLACVRHWLNETRIGKV